MNIQVHQKVTDLLNGYRQAQLIITAVRLGLFDLLGKEAKTTEQLASELRVSHRGICILCDALAAVGLLIKSGSKYRLLDAARDILLSDGSATMVPLIRHAALLYAKWGRLFEAVTTGKPVDSSVIDSQLVKEDNFAMAMASAAYPVAKETVDMLDLSNARSLLDVGGGPGIYAIEFALKNPELKVYLLDSKEAIKVAETNIKNSGVSNRIILVEGDVFNYKPPHEFCAVFMSNVIHQYGYDQNLALVKRCGSFLRGGGLLYIKDFVLDDDRTSPLQASLFAVNMLVNTENGNCYTEKEICEWVLASGLFPEKTIHLSLPSKIIVASKK